MVESKNKAVDLFQKVLRHADPTRLLPSLISLHPGERTFTVTNDTYPLPDHRQLFLIGTGKASAGMAQAMEEIMGDRIAAGMIISTDNPVHSTRKTEILTGSHPLPDDQSILATGQYIRFVEKIPAGAWVINLVSGGTSALFCKPSDPISLTDLQLTFQLLLNSGAGIDEMNRVRKALSEIKGGQFLQKLSHTRVIDLIISDVPNDNLSDIGSGPSIPQTISYQAARVHLKDRNLWDKLPDSVRTFLTQQISQNSNGEITTKEIPHHKTYLVSSGSIVAEKTAELLRANSYQTKLDKKPWTGPVENFVNHIMAEAEPFIREASTPTAMIFFGECSVQVTGEGKGGRNQELALRMIQQLSRYDRNLIFLSAGTDGIDGPTDAAGAVIDQDSQVKAEQMGLDIQKYLDQNDSYAFFEKFGGHIKTGPTGNNVMDLQLLLIP